MCQARVIDPDYLADLALLWNSHLASVDARKIP